MFPQSNQAPSAPPMPPPGAMPPNGGPPPGAPPGAGLPAPTMPPAPPQPSPQDLQQFEQLQEEAQAIALNKQVLDILRDEKTRGFRIEIETDSTVEPDESAEKQARVEFITAVGQFMQQALPAATTTPQILPMLKEMLLFLVRGFRAGRSMEDVIEKAMTDLAQAATQAQGNHVDPEQAKIEAQMKMADQQHQQKMQQADQQHQQALEQSNQQFQQKQAQDAQQFQSKLAIDKQAADNRLTADVQSREYERADAERQHQERLAEGRQQFAQKQKDDIDRHIREQAAADANRDADRQDSREDRLAARSHDEYKHTRQLEADREDRDFNRQAQIDDRDTKDDLLREKLGLPAKVKAETLDQINATAKDHGEKFDQVSTSLAIAGQAMAGLQDKLDALAAEIAAPLEILRDAKSGRAVGARKGNRNVTLTRGPDGRAVSIQSES